DAVLGEEGASRAGTSGTRWVIDPLDGTVNYLYGHPSGWSVSIAVEDEDGSRVGVVHDPMRGETFTATRAGGAFLNGAAITLTTVSELASALIGTGFAYRAEARAAQATTVARLL